MDPIQVLQELHDRPRLKVNEAYHVSTFRGVRERTDGATQHFTLTILDAGPTLGPMSRYTCKIETDDGLKLTGNPSESVEAALYILMTLEQT
jgi:hypothetical protein